MAPTNISQLQQALVEARSTLFLLPENPEFDQVAAALSLMLSVSSYGKQALISCPSPMVVDFNRLVGVDKVTSSLGGKNFIVEFGSDATSRVERVKYETGEDRKLKLIVVPKDGVEAPRKEELTFYDAGLAADLVILVGISSRNQIVKLLDKSDGEDLLSSKLVVINNTPSGEFPGAIEIVDQQSPSLSQTVIAIIEQANLPLDQDIATNLLMGLERGTGNFSAPTVSAETFSAAARLMQAGARKQQAGSPEQQENQVPEEWKGAPKVYKGSTLP